MEALCNMNLNDMEVYIYSIYNIINKLRGQIKFDFSQNDDKNICLEIVDSKIADIRPRDFIIEFDKNLGNFTIITNIELEDIKRRKIVSLVSNAINISQVASYTNHNLNLNFDYFIYDKTKTKRIKKIKGRRFKWLGNRWYYSRRNFCRRNI